MIRGLQHNQMAQALLQGPHNRNRVVTLILQRIDGSQRSFRVLLHDGAQTVSQRLTANAPEKMADFPVVNFRTGIRHHLVK